MSAPFLPCLPRAASAALRRGAGLLLLSLPGVLAAAPETGAIRVLRAPELDTTLTAQMAGRITSISGSLGSPVQKGKTIIAFDCAEAQARLRMAEAESNAARESHEAKTRMQALEAAGDTEVALAAAALDKARAQVALARTQSSQCTVSAPFSGRIARLHVKPHQGVNPGNALVDLVSDGPLKVRLNVPSSLLRQLKVGTRFEVAIDETGKTYPARVTAINARVDAVAQSIELEAGIEGRPTELLPGMSGVARFP